MKRKKYTSEFKARAVELAHVSECSVAEIAAELGIGRSMLHRWIRQSEADVGQTAFPGSGHPRDEELTALRKALRQAELERDILKKAVAFFAQAPQ